jgi:hypothetical protein
MPGEWRSRPLLGHERRHSLTTAAGFFDDPLSYDLPCVDTACENARYGRPALDSKMAGAPEDGTPNVQRNAWLRGTCPSRVPIGS